MIEDSGSIYLYEMKKIRISAICRAIFAHFTPPTSDLVSYSFEYVYFEIILVYNKISLSLNLRDSNFPKDISVASRLFRLGTFLFRGEEEIKSKKIDEINKKKKKKSTAN